MAMVPLAMFVVAAWLNVGNAPTNEPIHPINAVKPANAAIVELGKKLYFEPRLSKSGFISCNSCHNLSMGGSDNLKTSIGDKWRQSPISSPTVLNSSLNVAQFWEGRAKDLVPYKATSAAEGRYAVTGRDADRFNFKVPTLRNVELTYPYFHDGEAATLTRAVDIMGRLQFGRKYSDAENTKVVAFLKTLTGISRISSRRILPQSSHSASRPTPLG